jgi:membrane-associated phospholipid phosphatase
MKPPRIMSQTTDIPDAGRPEPGWRGRLALRLHILWLPKMTGTMLFMAGFFVVYFQLLNHPIYPVSTIPRLALDRLVGFCPETLPLYLSLWIYVSLPPAFLKNRRELVSYGLAVTVLGAIGFGVFLFWPTKVPKAEIDWSLYPAFSFLKTIDASGNACPSLHAAFAMFTALWFERLLREVGAGGFVRAVNVLWCLGILYSTIATRQHVMLDIMAGSALGAIMAVMHLRFLAGPGKPQRRHAQGL